MSFDLVWDVELLVDAVEVCVRVGTDESLGDSDALAVFPAPECVSDIDAAGDDEAFPEWVMEAP